MKQMAKGTPLGLLMTLFAVSFCAVNFCAVNWASAQYDPDLSYFTTAASGPASVPTTPTGYGLPLNQAYLFGGEITDATITLHLIDYVGNPIPGYPREDLWLESSLGGLYVCNLGTIADADTDANGETTFSGPFYAGGYTERDAGELTHVLVSGNLLNCPGVDVQFNTPDMDKNGDFNLSDLPIIVDTLFGAYNYRLDFWWDGTINLTDIAILAQMFPDTYGQGCP